MLCRKRGLSGMTRSKFCPLTKMEATMGADDSGFALAHIELDDGVPLSLGTDRLKRNFYLTLPNRDIVFQFPVEATADTLAGSVHRNLQLLPL